MGRKIVLEMADVCAEKRIQSASYTLYTETPEETQRWFFGIKYGAVENERCFDSFEKPLHLFDSRKMNRRLDDYRSWKRYRRVQRRQNFAADFHNFALEIQPERE